MMNYTIHCVSLGFTLISLWHVPFKSYVDVHDPCKNRYLDISILLFKGCSFLLILAVM